jgi:hypothetical protein
VSTVLSLVVVPAFYVIADRLSRRLRGVPPAKPATPATTAPMAEETVQR